MRQAINIIFLSLLGATLLAQAQHQHCGFHPGMGGGVDFKNRFLHHQRTLAELGGHLGPRDVQYVPVAFHIGRRSDGSGGVSIGRVLDQLCELNEDFEPHDIQFFLSPDEGIHEIFNTTFYESHDVVSNFMNLQRNNRAVDIFIPETANFTNEEGNTLAYYNIPRDWIVIGRTYVRGDDATLSHEMGHFFNLFHTFNGWEPEQFNEVNVNAPVISPGNVPTERANRTNCETAGDYLCDTREDYNNGLGWGNCNFTLNVLDPQGNPIDPDEAAYMGYFLQCDDEDYFFSNQQVSVMTLDLNSSLRNYLRLDPAPPYVEITEEVTLLSPADDAELENFNSISLTWDGVAGADAYFLEVSRIPTFSIEPIRRIVYGTSTVIEDLQADRNYYWRVRPFNSHFTCSNSSSTFKFRTGSLVNATTIEQVADFAVIPNPSNGDQAVQIRVQSTNSFDGTLTVTDLAGRAVIAPQRRSFTAGEQVIPLDLRNPAAGIYLVNLRSATGTLTQKLVITK
ncbi:MAG: zinc-dependent metalloprotease [Bacteroidota bacterium]